MFIFALEGMWFREVGEILYTWKILYEDGSVARN